MHPVTEVEKTGKDRVSNLLPELSLRDHINKNDLN